MGKRWTSEDNERVLSENGISWKSNGNNKREAKLCDKNGAYLQVEWEKGQVYSDLGSNIIKGIFKTFGLLAFLALVAVGFWMVM